MIPEMRFAWLPTYVDDKQSIVWFVWYWHVPFFLSTSDGRNYDFSRSFMSHDEASKYADDKKTV